MELQFDEALPVLRRTPTVLHALLLDLPGPWIAGAEGPGTWTPLDVVGHLIHGEGVVTLRQHFATWVAHDLSHVGQVVRVMARQYTTEVGPWRSYLSILRRA